MEKMLCSASVRTIVEFALLSGSLLPGSQLERMREGVQGHQARQRSLPEARSEVVVRGCVEGEAVELAINGRIDLLYERDGVPVVEEIKLAPIPTPHEEAERVHRAQAVCYGYLLNVEKAIIRVLYVYRDGTEAASFEYPCTRDELVAEFTGFVAPYLRMLEERSRWRALRDASIRALSFPYDGFRSGQREMAVQTYWAIKTKKRLFAQAPTGIGKTAAALFPALKALGEGDTGQIFYLTARTTAQESATTALYRMRKGGLRLRALTITAKEKICPLAAPHALAQKDAPWRCDPLPCPYAQGFFDRLPDALAAMRNLDDWSREAVWQIAETYTVCPFEFSLSLCEEADLALCDYNYAFDPGARIRRIFQWQTHLTLLVDEAHNLPDRARDMLSAMLDGGVLRGIRKAIGGAVGRKAPLYKALTALIQWINAQVEGEAKELSPDLAPLLSACMDEALAAMHAAPLGELTRILVAALGTLQRFDETYTQLTQQVGQKQKAVLLFCLDPGPHLREVTKKLHGSIFFSATLTPLAAWRDAIGGIEADGLLSLPSPFPQERLLVLRYPVSTKYHARDHTASAVADAILTVVCARSGNYLVCFPSYAYLRRVQQEIEARNSEVTLHIQRGGMDEAERAEYLSAFVPRDCGVLLGMIVLGGVFGEGVDLPGDRLSGAVIVGVGLPQICKERELLRAYYQRALGDGFAHAYRYPGMNKVLQAVGRVIRTETDCGVALLIDDRFLTHDYAALMPPWWGAADAVYTPQALQKRMEGFWQCGYST